MHQISSMLGVLTVIAFKCRPMDNFNAGEVQLACMPACKCFECTCPLNFVGNPPPEICSKKKPFYTDPPIFKPTGFKVQLRSAHFQLHAML